MHEVLSYTLPRLRERIPLTPVHALGERAYLLFRMNRMRKPQSFKHKAYAGTRDSFKLNGVYDEHMKQALEVYRKEPIVIIRQLLHHFRLGFLYIHHKSID